MTSAKNQIYHIDDIQTLRALRNYVADTYGQAKGLEGLDSMSEEEAQAHIEKVYGNHLSTFAKFLNEEANIIAGKTALIDRGLEGIIGRRGITFLNTVNQQVGANQTGFNVSSAITNFDSVVQAFAKSNKFDFVKAFAQTAADRVTSIFGKSDGFRESSPVVIRREGAQRFARTPWEKISDAGYTLMGATDSISTEIIARTKYNEFTRKGMDSETAHAETDKWVSRLMGDRSIGQMPQLYNSKMLGLITKYQLEVRNRLDSQFYDTIKDAQVSNEQINNALARNAKTAAKVASTFAQLAIGQHVFGKLFESIAGYNPALDIISVIATAFGFDDEEDSEDTVLDNVAQAFLELLEDMPYTSAILDGGRIPISSALPIQQLVTGKDEYGNEKPRLETALEAAPYYVLPGGYGQIKKTVKGLSMFDGDHPVAGSYTDSGNLRFPVDDTLEEMFRAGIFGQWSSENARDYFDGGRTPLIPKRTDEFIDSGMSIQEYWEHQDTLGDIGVKIENGTATDDEIISYKFMESMRNDVSELYREIEELNAEMIPNSASEQREAEIREQISELNKSAFENYGNVKYNELNGNRYAEIGDKYYKYDDEDGWRKLDDDQATKYKAVSSVPEGSHYATDGDNHYRWYVPEEGDDGETDEPYWKKISDEELEKQEEVTNGLGINAEEYWSKKDEYTFAYKSPGKYQVARAVGGYDAYKGYSGDLYDIKADKDADGKSISGSRKEKVLDYINGLDTDYGIKAAGLNGFKVSKPVEKPAPATVKVGSTVKLKAGARTYSGGRLAAFVYPRKHTVTALSGNRAVISYGGVVVAAVNTKDLTIVK